MPFWRGREGDFITGKSEPAPKKFSPNWHWTQAGCCSEMWILISGREDCQRLKIQRKKGKKKKKAIKLLHNGFFCHQENVGALQCLCLTCGENLCIMNSFEGTGRVVLVWCEFPMVIKHLEGAAHNWSVSAFLNSLNFSELLTLDPWGMLKGISSSLEMYTWDGRAESKGKRRNCSQRGQEERLNNFSRIASKAAKCTHVN